MSKDELMEAFDAVGGDGMLRRAFCLLADSSPKSAEAFLDTYEGVSAYNNYLSEDEAIAITKAMRNCDGSSGAKWSPDTLFEKVESLGGVTDLPGSFNPWALYAAMNMINSDHSNSLKKLTEDADTYAEACYNLAVDKLRDEDRPKWVREYFNL